MVPSLYTHDIMQSVNRTQDVASVFGTLSQHVVPETTVNLHQTCLGQWGVRWL